MGAGGKGYQPPPRSRSPAHLPAVTVDGASWAVNGHRLAPQNAEFVPVVPSPRMLLPSASADDQRREARAMTSQESRNEHVHSAQRPGSR
jgi:hypothetical protein